MNSDFCVAVHAMVYLNHKNCVLSSEELADNICTNPARVRKVMAKLKRVGLISTKEGSEGGYQFMGCASKVTLAEVAKALDVRFVSAGWHSGAQDKDCLVSSGMAGIMERILNDLDDCCKIRLQEKTIEDIDNEIFHKAKKPADIFTKERE